MMNYHWQFLFAAWIFSLVFFSLALQFLSAISSYRHRQLKLRRLFSTKQQQQPQPQPQPPTPTPTQQPTTTSSSSLRRRKQKPFTPSRPPLSLVDSATQTDLLLPPSSDPTVSLPIPLCWSPPHSLDLSPNSAPSSASLRSSSSSSSRLGICPCTLRSSSLSTATSAPPDFLDSSSDYCPPQSLPPLHNIPSSNLSPSPPHVPPPPSPTLSFDVQVSPKSKHPNLDPLITSWTALITSPDQQHPHPSPSPSTSSRPTLTDTQDAHSPFQPAVPSPLPYTSPPDDPIHDDLAQSKSWDIPPPFLPPTTPDLSLPAQPTVYAAPVTADPPSFPHSPSPLEAPSLYPSSLSLNPLGLPHQQQHHHHLLFQRHPHHHHHHPATRSASTPIRPLPLHLPLPPAPYTGLYPPVWSTPPPQAPAPQGYLPQSYLTYFHPICPLTPAPTPTTNGFYPSNATSPGPSRRAVSSSAASSPAPNGSTLGLGRPPRLSGSTSARHTLPSTLSSSSPTGQPNPSSSSTGTNISSTTTMSRRSRRRRTTHLDDQLLFLNQQHYGLLDANEDHHTPHDKLGEEKLKRMLRALKGRLRHVEADNDRKERDLEIARWRLRCVGIEKALEDIEVQKAIHHFLERAERAEAHLKVVEVKLEEVSKMKDRPCSSTLPIDVSKPDLDHDEVDGSTSGHHSQNTENSYCWQVAEDSYLLDQMDDDKDGNGAEATGVSEEHDEN